MPPALRKALPIILIGIVCIWVASLAAGPGDWDSDAEPAVHALATGKFDDYLRAEVMMGPFATAVQAPAVALSQASGAAAYGWAIFPCLLAAGLLGLYLSRIAARRGAGLPAQTLLALLCVLNPLTFEALANGHPEEVLTAALAIAAVASAAEGHSRRTALLLGLAIASKQWAVIAILPALMALPRDRVRTGVGAAAVAALLLLPGIIASPSSFVGVQTQAAGTGQVVTPWSAWYPAASSQTEVYLVDGEKLVAEVENAPTLADPLSHPLIILMALMVPLAVWLRRGLPLDASDAFALLALLALLRCVLDPVDNLYYHEPLLIALVGWDAFSSRGLPLRALVGVAVSLLFWRAWHDLSDPAAFNAAYLGAAFLLVCALVSSLLGPFHWTGVPLRSLFAIRSPNFKD